MDFHVVYEEQKNKEAFMLYDMEKDPKQFDNLAMNPEYHINGGSEGAAWRTSRSSEAVVGVRP